jgi:hypothetical protein
LLPFARTLSGVQVPWIARKSGAKAWGLFLIPNPTNIIAKKQLMPANARKVGASHLRNLKLRSVRMAQAPRENSF